MGSQKRTSTTTRNMEKDYDVSDIQHVMRVRSWRSYDDMIGWLRHDGMDDNELTPGEVEHMIEDLSRLKQQKKELITDPDQLYKALKRR